MSPIAVPLPSRIRRAARTPAQWEAAVDLAVAELRSTRSRWPFDTGRSLRAFRRIGSGFASVIWQPARYASYIRVGGRSGLWYANQTLRRATPRIIREIRAGAKPKTQKQRADSALSNVLRFAARNQEVRRESGLHKAFMGNARSLRAQGKKVTIGRSLRDTERRLRALSRQESRRPPPAKPTPKKPVRTPVSPAKPKPKPTPKPKPKPVKPPADNERKGETFKGVRGTSMERFQQAIKSDLEAKDVEFDVMRDVWAADDISQEASERARQTVGLLRRVIDWDTGEELTLARARHLIEAAVVKRIRRSKNYVALELK